MSDTKQKKAQKWRVSKDEKETPVEITLPKSGCIAKIYPSTGETSVKMQRMAGDDETRFMVCLMAILVTVDDERLLPEDFLEMNGPDYNTIQAELAKTNFM